VPHQKSILLTKLTLSAGCSPASAQAEGHPSKPAAIADEASGDGPGRRVASQLGRQRRQPCLRNAASGARTDAYHGPTSGTETKLVAGGCASAIEL
jgi:hypothetical protein